MRHRVMRISRGSLRLAGGCAALAFAAAGGTAQIPRVQPPAPPIEQLGESRLFELRDQPIYGPSGELIGRIVHRARDRRTGGQVLIVDTPGAPGAPHERIALPADRLRITAGQATVEAPLSREALSAMAIEQPDRYEIVVPREAPAAGPTG